MTGEWFAEHADWLPVVGSGDPADPGHIDWLLQRREGIGSSEASAVLGLSRYATALDVWLDKTGQIPLSDADNEAMRWGRLLEPVIRSQLADRLGLTIVEVPPLVSRARPWQRANLDGVVVDDPEGPAVVECKNTSHFLAEQWADDQVPDHAELQTQHSMAVTGATHAYVAGLIGGNRMVWRRVERDPAIINAINENERVLWEEHVLTGVAPPVVARQDVASMLRAITPQDEPLVVSPQQEMEVREYLADYEWGREAEAFALERKRKASNSLVWLAQGAPEVQTEAGEVLYRLQRGNFAARRFTEAYPEVADVTMKKIETLDTAALKREHPDLYRQFQSLSVRQPKKKKG